MSAACAESKSSDGLLACCGGAAPERRRSCAARALMPRQPGGQRARVWHLAASRPRGLVASPIGAPGEASPRVVTITTRAPALRGFTHARVGLYRRVCSRFPSTGRARPGRRAQFALSITRTLPGADAALDSHADFYTDALRFGSLRCFRHFSCALRGREELVITVPSCDARRLLALHSPGCARRLPAACGS